MKNIAYGKLPDQFGELRMPEGRKPLPVVVFIHGGFWQAQFGLDHVQPFMNMLTRQGVATWSIEYRRVGQEGGGWPGTFQDVAAAVDHLRDLAKNHPLDLERVITMGHSAGGHLALWVAARHRLAPGNPLLTPGTPLPLRGVVSLAGVGDLKQMHYAHGVSETFSGQKNNPTSDLLGGDENFDSRVESASPVELLPLGVPLELIHGSLDINVPLGISIDFAQTAEKAGDEVGLKILPYHEHFDLINPDSSAIADILESMHRLLEA